MMKIRLFYLSVLIASLILPVTVEAVDEGAHAAEFLSHGVGARALGMGSAFVAIADDATATYWNPAGLTKVKKHSFSAMYADTFSTGDGSWLSRGLVSYNFLNYVYQIQDIGSLGLSWIRLGVDDIPRTTFIDLNNNGILGDFQDKNGNGVKDDGELYIDKPKSQSISAIPITPCSFLMHARYTLWYPSAGTSNSSIKPSLKTAEQVSASTSG